MSFLSSLTIKFHYFALTVVHGLKGSKEGRLDKALGRSNNSKNSRRKNVKLQEGFPTDGSDLETTSPTAEWFDIASDSTGQYLVAVYSNWNETTGTVDGGIYTSDNYGSIWSLQIHGPGFNWWEVTSDSSGKYLAVIDSNYPDKGGIWTSDDYGTTWVNSSAPITYWASITSNSNGSHIWAADWEGAIYASTDYGSTWASTTAPIKSWSTITSDASGQYVWAACYPGGIYMSSDYGSTWSQSSADANADWTKIISSSSGQHLAALKFYGDLYLSSDYGSTWEQSGFPVTLDGGSVASDASGQFLAIVDYDGPIWISSDYGTTWSNISIPDNTNWNSVTSDSTGQYLAATSLYGGIYTISPYTPSPTSMLDQAAFNYQTTAYFLSSSFCDNPNWGSTNPAVGYYDEVDVNTCIPTPSGVSYKVSCSANGLTYTLDRYNTQDCSGSVGKSYNNKAVNTCIDPWDDFMPGHNFFKVNCYESDPYAVNQVNAADDDEFAGGEYSLTVYSTANCSDTAAPFTINNGDCTTYNTAYGITPPANSPFKAFKGYVSTNRTTMSFKIYGDTACKSESLIIEGPPDTCIQTGDNGYKITPRSYEIATPWLHCPHIHIPERIMYDSMDYNPMTGDFSMTGVHVGFFKLVRKVVVYAIRRQPSQPDVRIKQIKIKITPGTSKFPLKSPPLENAGEVNFIRVKIIGNRVGEGSKSTTGEKSHPYWECAEKHL